MASTNSHGNVTKGVLRTDLDQLWMKPEYTHSPENLKTALYIMAGYYSFPDIPPSKAASDSLLIRMYMLV